MNDTPLPLLPSVPPVDAARLQAAWLVLDNKTKPPRSLGQLEALAARYVAVRGEHVHSPRCCVVVMAADHGVAAQGVSAYPQAVTAQMLGNFAAGGAAINALCENAGSELLVLDVGTIGATPPGVRDVKVRQSSRDFTREAALTPEEVSRALSVGLHVADELEAKGIDVVGLGEMGIANTTVASATCAALLGVPAERVVGRGTGVDDAGVRRKIATVEAALKRHESALANPLHVLERVGGLEIAALCGLILGAAAKGQLVVLDGFITSAAALVAHALRPQVVEYCVAAHQSVEPGHALVLDRLGLSPLLKLDLRLGEGSGAALSLPLVTAAHAVYRDMATFESAGVSREQSDE